MVDCKVDFTPLPECLSFSIETYTPHVNRSLYCHTVSQLFYLINTLPNLAYSVGFVSRFMAHLQEAHWIAVQHILWYV